MQVSLLFPIIMMASVLLLVIFALFEAAIKSLFTKKAATPLNTRREVVFKPSVDGAHIATRKTIAAPFLELTQVPVSLEHILPSRRLLMTETMKLPELKAEQIQMTGLEAEEMQMTKRAREPVMVKP